MDIFKGQNLIEFSERIKIAGRIYRKSNGKMGFNAGNVNMWPVRKEKTFPEPVINAVTLKAQWPEPCSIR